MKSIIYLPVPTKGSNTNFPDCDLDIFDIMKDNSASILVFPS